MKKIVVLGAGMVGSAMALDLAAKYDVTVVDRDNTALAALSSKSNIKTIQSDFTDFKKIGTIVKKFDFVVGAVPGFLGFRILETVIKAGKDIVDISFFPEDCFLLDELAKKHEVTAIMDCGVAPGMSNLILGFHEQTMKITDFECLVGGLPFVREFPFQYKAPFSPIDVLEEYTRPARYVENGVEVVKPALSDAEYVFFEEVGTLESFNSDGLRSIVKTVKAPNMKEKTLRYPGHIQLIQALKAGGFFSTEEIEVGGTKIKPLDFTTKILFDKWKLQPGENEFTIMRITVEGTEKGKKKKYVYNLFDTYDKETGISSMSRTTGYTCTATVNLILEGKFSQKGVFPPEFVGRERDCTKYILDYLKQRNVIYRVTEE